MNDLAIDTAGAGCSAALRLADHGGDAKTFCRYADIQRGHAETIVGQVEAIVDEAGIDYHSLNRIICTIGPGSFTGVRVGIAFAKGLALATGLPLYGLSSTLAAGLKISRFLTDPTETNESLLPPFEKIKAGDVCQYAVVLDAGRREFYVQSFRVCRPDQVSSSVHDAAPAFEAVSSPLLLSHADVPDFNERSELNAVYGSGAEEFISLLASKVGAVKFGGLIKLKAEDLLNLEDRHYVKEDEVCPLYLRAPDAKPQMGKTLIRRLS